MFHLAAHRGFAVFNVALPVNGVVRNPGQLARPAVDAEFDCGKPGVMFDFIPFRFLLSPAVFHITETFAVLGISYFENCSSGTTFCFALADILA